MMGKFILVDMDETAFDFDKRVIEEWDKILPDLARINSNDLKIWNFPENYEPKYTERILSIWKQPGFFRNLEPIPFAVKAINEMIDYGHMVYFCSTPTTSEPYCVYEKLQSIYEHFGGRMIDNVILTKDKTLIKADYLIDDRPVITGAMKPSWQHILFDRGRQWGKNFHGPKLSNWNNWKEVIS